MDTTYTTNIDPETMAKVAERAVQMAFDTDKERAAVMELVTDEGFKRKLELIDAAEDLSTAEKLEALERAEDKRLADLEQGAEIHQKIMWDKVILIIAGIGLIVGAATSPQGTKFIQSTFKRAG